jgi:ComF family protein
MSLRSLLTVVAPPLCAGCGASAGSAEPLCPRCRSSLRWLDGARWGCGMWVWGALHYEGAARALVHALKFRGVAGMAATMGAQVAAVAPGELLDGYTLVPVPIHPARLRKRGFNQAELLANEIGLRRGCPVVDCLERIGPARTQLGRDKYERLDAMESTVRVRPGAPVPSHVVVVDDVMTTGATIGACASALYRGGTELLGALVYAHTPGK